ncbi:hypothetical protein Tco_0275379 [Tanacetum coccineum]
MIGEGAPNRGITNLGLKREIQSMSIDKVQKWLRLSVNRDRHKSSRNMQTTRYKRLSMVREKHTVRKEVSPHVSRSKLLKVGEDSPPIFTLSCFNLRRPNTFGIPSLFGASSNPTGDLSQRVGVASLRDSGLSFISRYSS